MQRGNVWFMINIDSHDQLRQRMAWALSQTFIINTFNVSILYLWNVPSYITLFTLFLWADFNKLEVVRDVLKLL